MPRILFLSTRNACRSQMAEGFARARAGGDVEILSAGTAATGLDARATRAMAEIGIDIAGHQSNSLADLGSPELDVVVILCRQADEGCPLLPGHPARVSWVLADPSEATGSEADILDAFRAARDRIRHLVDDLFDQGYLTALVDEKQCADLILDNISDAIIAHDLKRRVFYFNRGAEKLTGYARAEVLGHDCHDVFPGNFCGGKCIFCEERPPEFEVERRKLQIATKAGEKRFVDMSIRPMKDSRGKRIGVLVACHDMTREHDLARRVGETQSFAGIIGRDKTMLEVFDLIRDLADSTVPVLIEGESGTGKELVAAAIHNEGHRGNKLFVPVNCGALPEALLESELFGHVRGAFTGAIRDKKGRFELAHGGTIFLDEVGDISPAMQVKLLRVLQEGTFERVGSERTVKVDVRLISATNKNLAHEIEEGRFREDLYYRLSVVPLLLPPLRDRRNDIPLLVDYVMKDALRTTGRKGIKLSPDALDMMMSYDWPGNVRELQNWIQFALVKCKGELIRPAHLPPARRGAPLPRRQRRRGKLHISSVREALRQTDGNKVEAAKVLGVSRATLYRFLDDAGAEL